MNLHTPKRSRGFTLIELMLALFLFGMVVAAMFSTWAAVVRGAKSGREAAAAVQRSRMAVRTIENALTCTRSFAADIEHYAFVAENGSDASLSFVARLPNSFPRGGKFSGYNVRRVIFSLEPGVDGKRLVMRQHPILMELDQQERETPVVLSRNVDEFEMEFWDRRTREWLDDWTQTNQVPLMVKFTLRFKGAHSMVGDEVTRVVSVPSVTVQPGWQMPGYNPPRPQGPLRPGQMNNPGGVQ